jgi:exodeoxyribonuclease VII small subunit
VTATPPGELAYRDALAELDAIVRELEGEDVDVDVVADRLERATALVSELQRRIHDAQVRVERLTPRLEQAASTPDAADEQT